jgi:hypothetical protein
MASAPLPAPLTRKGSSTTNSKAMGINVSGPAAISSTVGTRWSGLVIKVRLKTNSDQLTKSR